LIEVKEMGPIVLPESFQRRRSREGCDLPTISAMSSEEKSGPSSPKMESKNRLRSSKSQETLFPYPSLSDRAWASRSRDNLSNHNDDGQSILIEQASGEKQSLFRDLVQTQLSLWTFTVSTLLTYFWQKRVHLRSVLFAVCALSLTGFLSWVLATVVTLAHLFNSDFAASFGGFGDWLGDDEQKYPQLLRRQSSSQTTKSRRSSGSGTSGSTTPRGACAGGQEKFQQGRFWQKKRFVGTFVHRRRVILEILSKS
jgi:hypothetical protein